ncbi:hypothetical protein FA13DRAFT_1717788 [Coprinellus micaceus]|uniref:Uncharacterized protein n=1 Tax=Coprinellus micaceus TaxID=71717 RepID=A0A4Y7SF72_COPMI|nr:hypothetical protein FA13DRAFT_1717788 [Coprinellus micaceus]
MPNVRLSDGIMLNRDECFISICHGRVTRHARYIVTTEPQACRISGHSENCGGVNFAVWGKVPKLGVSREVPPLSKRGELASPDGAESHGVRHGEGEGRERELEQSTRLLLHLDLGDADLGPQVGWCHKGYGGIGEEFTNYVGGDSAGCGETLNSTPSLYHHLRDGRYLRWPMYYGLAATRDLVGSPSGYPRDRELDLALEYPAHRGRVTALEVPWVILQRRLQVAYALSARLAMPRTNQSRDPNRRPQCRQASLRIPPRAHAAHPLGRQRRRSRRSQGGDKTTLRSPKSPQPPLDGAPARQFRQHLSQDRKTARPSDELSFSVVSPISPRLPLRKEGSLPSHDGQTSSRGTNGSTTRVEYQERHGNLLVIPKGTLRHVVERIGQEEDPPVWGTSWDSITEALEPLSPREAAC